MRRCSTIIFIHLLATLLLSSCVFNAGKMTATSPKRAINIVSVTKVEIINHQLILTGKNLENVQDIKVQGSSFDEAFSIESKSTSQIIANSMQAISMGVGGVFNLILSDAKAAATFQIDFSLCNSSLNGKGFDCSITPHNNDVLSYDQTSGKWIPKTINLSGLNFMGSLDASSGTSPSAMTAGEYWIISVAGTIGSVNYKIGDWLVYNGTTFDKIDNSSAVTMVHGRIGDVVAAKGDYNLGQMSNVDLGSADNTGKYLKYNGTNWVPATIVTAPAAGSITATEIADGTVTNIKIADVDASKITGTLSGSQIGTGVITNANISASAAIDYSKLNIQDGAIPYAKLTIVDGAIPQTKISGLSTALSTLIEDTVTNGVTGKAPTENAVYNFVLNGLNTKLNLTGGTISVGTIDGIPDPTPFGGSAVANKTYVDNQRDTRVAKSGDTMTGALRFQDSGTNYVGLKSPTTVGASFDFVLPDTKGTAGQVLKSDGAGNLVWYTIPTNYPSTADLATTNTNVTNLTTALATTNSTAATLATTVAGKEPAITAGTASQYWKGNKTWQVLDTLAVPENTNLYFTSTRAINALKGADFGGLATITGLTDPLVSGDAVNLGYLTSNYTTTANLNSSLSGFVTFPSMATALTSYALLTDLNTNNSTLSSSIAGKLNLTGGVLTGDLYENTQIQLKDGSTSGNANYVALKANSTTTAYTFTLPATKGLANQVLQTDGNGNTSWYTISDNYATTTALTTANTNITNLTTALATTNSTATTLATTVAGKEPAITAGTASQYWKGDKTWGTFATDAISALTSTLANYATTTDLATTNTNVTNLTTTVTGHSTSLATDASNILQLQTDVSTLTTGLAATNSTASTLATTVGTKLPLAGGTLTGDLKTETNIQFKDSTTNYVTLKANGTTTPYTLTLPGAVGLVGQVLKTDASGNLSWYTISDNYATTTALATANTNITNLTSALATTDSTAASLATTVAGKEPAITAGTASQYWKGDKTWGTFLTDVMGSLLTNLSTATNSAITASDNLLAALGKLQAQITSQGTTISSHTTTLATHTTDISTLNTAVSGKEPTITNPNDTTKYWRGDKTFVTLNTAAVAENASYLYYTDARAIAAPLSTFVTGANSTILNTDTVVGALQKVQGQINANATTVSGKLTSTLTSAYLFVGNSSNVATGVALSGDATISNAGVLTLANSGATAGTYKSVTVDAKGRVTAGTNPTTLSGYGITDTLVNSVGVTAPITNTGTASAPVIAIPAATTSVNGYLTSTDWTTFNNKEPAITAGTTAQYLRGNKTLSTFATDVIAAPLTGLTSAAGTITSSDTVLTAMNKLAFANGDYISKTSNQTVNGTLAINQLTGDLIIPTSPMGATSAVNKTYVDTADALKLNLTGGTLTGTLNLAAGTTTVAPIVLASGTNLTTPANGAMEFNGTNFYLTSGGSRKLINLDLLTSTNSFTGVNTFSNTTDSSSVATGGVVINGGLGVAKVLNVGTKVGIGLSTGAGGTPTATLDIDGADTSSGTSVMHIENSAAAAILNITNDGAMTIGGTAASLTGSITVGNNTGTAATTIRSGTGGVTIGAVANTTGIAGSTIALTGATTASSTLTVTGNVTAPAYYYSSDRRLKENIQGIKGLESILGLRGVSFTWIKTGEPEIGLIAQEVEEVLPVLVKTNPETGIKAVKYGNIVAPLIEAVKELYHMVMDDKKQVQNIERKIASEDVKVKKLESEVEKLKAENAQLKADVEEIKRAIRKK